MINIYLLIILSVVILPTLVLTYTGQETIIFIDHNNTDILYKIDRDTRLDVRLSLDDQVKQCGGVVTTLDVSYWFELYSTPIRYINEAESVISEILYVSKGNVNRNEFINCIISKIDYAISLSDTEIMTLTIVFSVIFGCPCITILIFVLVFIYKRLRKKYEPIPDNNNF